MERKLTVTQDTFNNMISGLISSGVTFNAIEKDNGNILIEFLGGY